ncbi:uncharacterized protein LOC121760311 [Salvia splendens]|uniref:uncharacterized protein LOC121760311 n=1 Tax=Salvia splendens TaxID=180675 RepID=UPI001C267B02|nr:uncharacterized protein LOC121760311 [Salvia splendens]
MNRRRVHVKRNDGDKLRVICKGQGCEWYVYLRKHEIHNGRDYVVMNMQRDHAHTCSQVLDLKWLTAKWLGERYMKKIKASPHIPLAAIRQCVDEDFGLKIGRMKAYRAREHALDGIFGSVATQYRNLFYYKAEFERMHTDSSIHIHYENTRDGAVCPRFLRFYCCLGPLKKGWMQLCRTIIFFGACFLQGMYKGQLMTTMGIDSNNGWWPIAWAVTEAESYVQWKWVVEYLSDDLNLHANGPRYVFMSDQQKGLAKLIVEEFRQSEHRFCVQHKYNNFKKRFVGKFQRPVTGDYLEYHPRTLCGQDGCFADRPKEEGVNPVTTHSELTTALPVNLDASGEEDSNTAIKSELESISATEEEKANMADQENDPEISSLYAHLDGEPLQAIVTTL